MFNNWLVHDDQLADMWNQEFFWIQPVLADVTFKIQYGVPGGIITKLEGPPLGGDEKFGAQINKGLDRLVNIHVCIMHEPARIVGSDGQQCIIYGRILFPELLVADEITTVAAEIDGPFRSHNHITGPQRVVRRFKNPQGPVLGRQTVKFVSIGQG